jgi:hypothetical protein
MTTTTRKLAIRIAAAFFAALAACDNTIVDEWGGPAGWSRVMGTVVRSNGTGAADLEILVTRCASPLGGLAGTGRTGPNGSFAVDASLPPAGVLLASVIDTLHTECTIVADRGFAEKVVELTWSTQRSSAPVVIVELREGDRVPAFVATPH